MEEIDAFWWGLFFGYWSGTIVTGIGVSIFYHGWDDFKKWFSSPVLDATEALKKAEKVQYAKVNGKINEAFQKGETSVTVSTISPLAQNILNKKGYHVTFVPSRSIGTGHYIPSEYIIAWDKKPDTEHKGALSVPTGDE